MWRTTGPKRRPRNKKQTHTLKVHGHTTVRMVATNPRVAYRQTLALYESVCEEEHEEEVSPRIVRISLKRTGGGHAS